MKALFSILLFAVINLVACTPIQKIFVNSEPSGAKVSLTKYGVREGGGTGIGAAITAVAVSGEKVTEGPISLGFTPVSYEFPLSETEVSVIAPHTNIQVHKVYQEGLIRVEKDGAFVERRVVFSGDPLILEMKIEIQPVNPTPPPTQEAAPPATPGQS